MALMAIVAGVATAATGTPQLLPTRMGAPLDGRTGLALSRVVQSFDRPLASGAVFNSNSSSALDPTWSAGGGQSLRITYNAGSSSAWLTLNVREDFRNQSSFTFQARNPNSFDIDFMVQVRDSANQSMWARFTADAGSDRLYNLVIQPDLLDGSSFGFAAFPNPIPGSVVGFSKPNPSFNASSVRALTFIHNSGPRSTAMTFNIDEISVQPLVDRNSLMSRMVDAYGQQARDNWSGKVLGDGDLGEPVALAVEQDGPVFDPAFTGRDRFGGTTLRGRYTATGYFRTQTIGAKSWFITPDGYPFFSLGVTSVRPDASETLLEGRESLFADIPTGSDPLAAHVYVSTQDSRALVFNPYGANLQRSLGANWQSLWLTQTLDRVTQWGLNTLGNGTDRAFIGNGRVAYTPNLLTYQDATSKFLFRSSKWIDFPDPFDPTWKSNIATRANRLATRLGDDPFVLGIWGDNELPWTGDTSMNERYVLARAALKLAASASPAKTALLADLRRQYGTVGRLNASWGTRFASWDSMNASFTLRTPYNMSVQRDLKTMESRIADEYFRSVRTALKTAMPNYLYLGCRFAWFSPEALAASDRHADVNSFNIYAPTVNDARFAPIALLTKPTIIGEFHFGARDSGLPAGGTVAVGNQRQRGEAYDTYMASVLANNKLIGAHWYKYTDDSFGGRANMKVAESYNAGLVSITNRPYGPITDRMRLMGQEIYNRR